MHILCLLCNTYQHTSLQTRHDQPKTLKVTVCSKYAACWGFTVGHVVNITSPAFAVCTWNKQLCEKWKGACIRICVPCCLLVCLLWPIEDQMCLLENLCCTWYLPSYLEVLPQSLTVLADVQEMLSSFCSLWDEEFQFCLLIFLSHHWVVACMSLPYFPMNWSAIKLHTRVVKNAFTCQEISLQQFSPPKREGLDKKCVAKLQCLRHLTHKPAEVIPNT